MKHSISKGIIIIMALAFGYNINLMAKGKKSKPNIVILFADDISAREFPIYGSKVWSKPTGGNTTDPKYRAHTPVMDKLANEGVWIKTAWAATVCSPSRAMMMTGRYAHLHKWWNNGDLGTSKAPDGSKKKTQIYPFYESTEYTIGAVAAKGGYNSYWAGKTQMKGNNLLKYSFDEGCFTPGEQGAPENPYTDFAVVNAKRDGKKVVVNKDNGKVVDYYAQSGWYWKPHVRLMNHPDTKGGLTWWPNTPESKKEFGLNTYGPDVELDFIFDFMDRKKNDKKPFLIYHTTHLGHDGWDFFNTDAKVKSKWPSTPKIEWKNGKYTRTKPNITGDKGVYNTHGTITEAGIHNHINYIDYQVWQYLNKFEELGVADNTVFIICADNGTSGYGKNSPVMQKGTHVPMIIYAPGFNFTKHGEQDILVNIADVLPTIAELGGVTFPKDYEVNGVSLWPYLTTKTTKHRDWIYAYRKDAQLIRGEKVMKDGKDNWYDVSGSPDDLISFPKITDWGKVSEVHRAERKKLEEVLPRFDLHDKEHDAPVNK